MIYNYKARFLCYNSGLKETLNILIFMNILPPISLIINLFFTKQIRLEVTIKAEMYIG